MKLSTVGIALKPVLNVTVQRVYKTPGETYEASSSHPKLNPKLDQAWEINWTGVRSSRQTSASASPSLRNFFQVVPEFPISPASSPLTNIPNSGQQRNLKSPEDTHSNKSEVLKSESMIC